MNCCAALLVCLFAIASGTGCSTLSSLGLPFGNTQNNIADSARTISGAPGLALQLPRELEKMPLDVYIVEIGDTIFVEPVNFDSSIRLPGDQIVRPDGSISIGEFGDYDAVNKTIDQISVEVQAIIDNKLRFDLEQEFLQEERRRMEDRQAEQNELSQSNRRSESNDFPDESETAEEDEQNLRRERQRALERKIEERLRQNRVSVRLVNWDSKRIYVLGEVNSPGYFSYTGNQTVLDAIVDAGGLTSRSNNHQVIVSRPTPCGSCRVVMQVCYDQIVQLGDTSTNYQLLPGDRVFVPSLTFADDLKRTFSLNRDSRCPRCGPPQVGCGLDVGCGAGAGCSSGDCR